MNSEVIFIVQFFGMNKKNLKPFSQIYFHFQDDFKFFNKIFQYLIRLNCLQLQNIYT